jgi:hypothetical protein
MEWEMLVEDKISEIHPLDAFTETTERIKKE